MKGPLIEGLTSLELRYLEACMEVADGDGEHAAEYNIDVGALQVKLHNLIDVMSAAEAWLDAEARNMKEKE